MSFSYVAFTGASQHWTKYLLDDYCNHCFIVEPMGHYWLVINNTSKGVEVFTEPSVNAILDGSKLIKVKRKIRPKRLFMFDTCVSYVKQYMGISNPLIQTPKQLHDYLESKDGRHTKSTKANSRRKSASK